MEVLHLPLLKLLSQNPLLGTKLHLLDLLHHNLRKSIPSHQNGDTAVIIAIERYKPAIVKELVRAGSDLNLQNQVRYTVTVDTAPHITPVLHIRRESLH